MDPSDYDFDLKTGNSDHGMRACVYAVQLRPQLGQKDTGKVQVWVETPGPGVWEVVEIRPVSEGMNLS